MKPTGMILASCALVAHPAAAQQAGPGDAHLELRRSFAEVSAWVSKAAELVPAEKYSSRPTVAVRTFGQLIGHIADSYTYYCAYATGREVQWSDPVEKGPTDKAALAPRLRQATESCTGAYNGSGGRYKALVDNLAHTSLHYGNIITYLRMFGLVPPSS